MHKKVLVVDLDGTLYKCNTFHKFLLFLLQYFLKMRALFKLLKLLVIVAQRLFRLISHSKLKYKVLLLLQNVQIDLSPFISQLSNYKNEIEELMDTEFDIKILATAAPRFYAESIAEAEGFDVCLATKLPKDGYNKQFENLGEQKKHTLLEYLSANNLKSINVFITDHIDDAPVARIAKHNIIYNPSKAFMEWLEKNDVNFEVR